jgi:hypothetical protein
MTGADARSIVAMEIFVEQNQIAPVRIALEFFRIAVNRPPPVLIAQENIGKTTRDISFATSHSVVSRREPVGHSTLKSFP